MDRLGDRFDVNAGCNDSTHLVDEHRRVQADDVEAEHLAVDSDDGPGEARVGLQCRSERRIVVLEGVDVVVAVLICDF